MTAAGFAFIFVGALIAWAASHFMTQYRSAYLHTADVFGLLGVAMVLVGLLMSEYVIFMWLWETKP